MGYGKFEIDDGALLLIVLVGGVCAVIISLIIFGQGG